MISSWFLVATAFKSVKLPNPHVHLPQYNFLFTIYMNLKAKSLSDKVFDLSCWNKESHFQDFIRYIVYKCQPPPALYLDIYCKRKPILCLVHKESISGVHDVWVTLPSPSTTLPHPGEACGAAASALLCVSGQCSSTQVRDGTVVRWAPHWAKPRSHCVALCVAAGQKTDCELWLSTSAPETVPSAPGPAGSLSPVSDQLQSPRRGPEQSCRAQNTAKTQSEPSCAAGTFVSNT